MSKTRKLAIVAALVLGGLLVASFLQSHTIVIIGA